MSMPSDGVAALPLFTTVNPVLAWDLQGDEGSGRQRDGKKDGEKFSLANSLWRLMPAVPGRCADQRRGAPMASGMVARVDIDVDRSRKVSFGRIARKPAPMLVLRTLTVRMAVRVCERATCALQINSLEGSLRSSGSEWRKEIWEIARYLNMLRNSINYRAHIVNSVNIPVQAFQP